MKEEHKIKVLLIGDCNHQLIINQVKNLINEKGILFSAFSLKIISDVNQHYFQNISYSRPIHKKVKKGGFWKIRSMFSIIIRFLKISTDYEVVHINFLKTQYLLIWPLIRLKKKKIIVSIWGSEFFRANKYKRRLLGILWKRADLLHCANPELKKRFIDYYNIPKEKIYVIPFTLETLEIINRIDTEKLKLKKELGWSEDKLQVLVGYNYNEGQQHLKIIDVLSKINKEDSRKIQFVFPLTYGNNKGYRDKVISSAKNKLNDSIFITSFLPSETNSKVRMASDVFINLQTTDQYSASMIESLYTGNIIITGSWLPYEPLKKNKVFFLELNSINELNNCMSNILEQYEILQSKTLSNQKLLDSMFDKELLIDQWYNLYLDTINK